MRWALAECGHEQRLVVNCLPMEDPAPVSAMVVGGLVSVLGWWGKRAEGGVVGGLAGACLCT